MINYFKTETDPWDFNDRLILTHEKGKFLIFKGYRLGVREAPEPSNIIWENQAVGIKSQRKKKLQAYVIIFVLLIISAIFITLMKSMVYSYNRKYPINRNCDYYDNTKEDTYKMMA